MSVVGATMRDYYERRAREYDDWWLGTGLYARRERPGWHDELQRVISLLEDLAPARTLDVACGTGFLTRHLPGAVTGLDQSATMVEIASARGLEVVQAEAVPLPFGDDAFERLFTARRRVTAAEDWQRRRLNDGSEHDVYKRWFGAPELAREVGGEVLHDGHWFVAVRAGRAPAPL